MNKVGLLEVKQAIWDQRFRDLFPELKKELGEYLKNPGCPCNVSLYKSILKHRDRLAKYFPGREVAEESEAEPKNNFSVINCNVNELEAKLRKLRPGRKQIAVARWQDQATVIVNDLD